MLRAIRARVKKIRFTYPETLLFSTCVGTSNTTNNIRRQLRDVIDRVGGPEVTPPRSRRTAVTAANEIGKFQLASELLGHGDHSITRKHCICRNETVNPVNAEFLERACGKVSLARSVGSRFRVLRILYRWVPPVGN